MQRQNNAPAVPGGTVPAATAAVPGAAVLGVPAAAFTDAGIPLQPYPELRDVLATFVAAISDVLHEDLIGAYLVGSLASGDFDADSDIDFLVVTRAELSDAQVAALQEVQRAIFTIECYPARHLEGSYISLHDLNDAATVGQKPLVYFDNGSTTVERATHDNQWHVRWILRERGITLVGPEPATLLPPIPEAPLRQEVSAALHLIARLFEAEIHTPLNFYNSRFGQSFFVLTACRMLHTLHTATVQSKKAGAAWAKDHLAPTWIPLIDQAWAERKGVRFGVKIGQRAELPLLLQTLAFLHYAASDPLHPPHPLRTLSQK